MQVLAALTANSWARFRDGDKAEARAVHHPPTYRLVGTPKPVARCKRGSARDSR